MLQYGRQYRETWRTKVLIGYGHRCACCGEAHAEFLAVDHINNDGAVDRKVKKLVGAKWWRWLVLNNFPPEYRLLCHNCNNARAFYGTCPHELERVA